MLQPKELPYKVIKVIGQGGEGTVHLVQKLNSEEKFVMKKRVCSDLPSANEALREALTLAQNRSNEFIVRYHDIFLDREIRSGVELISLCIVMELCDGGDIAIFIEQAAAEKKPIDSQTVKRWCSEMIRGVKFMHDSNTIHRDLKSENVFLTSSGSIKIGDFGLAQLLPKHSKMKGVEGSTKCMAPEVFRKENYDCKADIFSLGCIWWELGATRSIMREPKAFCQLAAESASYDPVQIASPISDPKLRALVSLMLAKDPADRPTASQVLMDAYFMGSSHNLNELALSSPSALIGADVKQLHAAHIDEVAKVMTATSMTDPRYVYCLPGKVSGTVDAELCLYTATQLVKFAFESHGSVWGHLKDGTIQGVAALRRPYESQLVVSPFKALKFAVNAPSVKIDTLRKFLLLQKHLNKNAKTIMGKRPYWHLLQLSVLPGAQNQGIGTQLLSPILKWADQDKLPIFAEAWSELAVTFLKKNGFKVVAENKYEALVFWSTIREPK